MNGLGDYVLLGQSCDYPPIVGQWSAISDTQIASFTPPDFCRGDCFEGLGDAGLFGTGLFVGGPSTWGSGEYAALAGGAFLLLCCLAPVGRKYRRRNGR